MAKTDIGGGRTTTSTDGVLAALTRAVEALYEVHDHVFGADKQERLRALVGAAEALCSSELLQLPQACVLLGRALDALEAPDARAEELLTRAVKREPASTAAWAALGHCLWKKGDLDGAVSCYERARDGGCVSALRSLSQLARLQGRIADGVASAKAAVAADVTEPRSWAILGNALLAAFIAAGRDAAALESAHRAFTRARGLEAADAEARARSGRQPRCGDPDLRFNQAQARLYAEDVQDAIDAFTAAGEIDPSLPCAAAIAGARARGARIAAAVATRGSARPKRIAELATRAASTADALPPAVRGRPCVTLAALRDSHGGGGGGSGAGAAVPALAAGAMLCLAPLLPLPSGGLPPA